MQRDTQAIEADIDAQRRMVTQAQQTIGKLEGELSRAGAMNAADQRQRQHIARVLARMEFGESIVATPRPWWCRGGQLIERASADEMNALFALQRQGLIEGRRA